MTFDAGHSVLLSFSIFLMLFYRYGRRPFLDLLDTQIKVAKQDLKNAADEKEATLATLYTRRRRHLEISTNVDSILEEAQGEIFAIRNRFFEDLEGIKASRQLVAETAMEHHKIGVFRDITATVINLSVASMMQFFQEQLSAQGHEALNQDAIQDISKAFEKVE